MISGAMCVVRGRVRGTGQNGQIHVELLPWDRRPSAWHCGIGAHGCSGLVGRSAVRSSAEGARAAAVGWDGFDELGEELGVGVGFAEAFEEHVDGLLAVSAVEGPAQRACGGEFPVGEQ